MTSAPDPPRDRAQYVGKESFFASRDYPLDLESTELAGHTGDRGWYPEGEVRQLAAILGLA